MGRGAERPRPARSRRAGLARLLSAPFSAGPAAGGRRSRAVPDRRGAAARPGDGALGGAHGPRGVRSHPALFRSTDIVSHNEWKYFEPGDFDAIDPREMAAPGISSRASTRRSTRKSAASSRPLPRAPRARASDHGFHSAHREQVKALVDMDAILERLGYLARGKGGIDFSRTRVYTYGSPDFERTKMLRFSLAGREPGGRVRPEEREALRGRLEADLAPVTNERGEPVLFLRDVRPKRGEDGDSWPSSACRDTPVLKIRGRAVPGGPARPWRGSPAPIPRRPTDLPGRRTRRRSQGGPLGHPRP